MLITRLCSARCTVKLRCCPPKFFEKPGVKTAALSMVVSSQSSDTSKPISWLGLFDSNLVLAICKYFLESQRVVVRVGIFANIQFFQGTLNYTGRPDSLIFPRAIYGCSLISERKNVPLIFKLAGGNSSTPHLKGLKNMNKMVFLK